MDGNFHLSLHLFQYICLVFSVHQHTLYEMFTVEKTIMEHLNRIRIYFRMFLSWLYATESFLKLKEVFLRNSQVTGKERQKLKQENGRQNKCFTTAVRLLPVYRTVIPKIGNREKHQEKHGKIPKETGETIGETWGKMWGNKDTCKELPLGGFLSQLILSCFQAASCITRFTR